MRKRPAFALLALAALTITLVPSGLAIAHPPPRQHGPSTDHLLGSGAFGVIDLVSVERVTETNDLVADVAVSPNNQWAFLANWGEPDCDFNSEKGGQNSPDAGAWVVDISDLEDPETVGFIPSSQDTRPGEGMQVINFSTKFFTGQVLAMNNEQCGGQGKGGISLWNVSNPRKPKKLVDAFGDRSALINDPNTTHSIFIWDAGSKAYAVATDNEEFPDVDIYDITNPKRPRLIAEYDINDFDVDQPEIGLIDSFLHDMVVKKIGNDWILLLSYWDGGYVQMNVNDPADAQFISDTEYAAIDPELADPTNTEVPAESRTLPPEGNGHEAEFTLDNEMFVATDEDFGPYRTDDFMITSGPHVGTYPSVIVPGAASPAILDDLTMNGPTVYGGYGCPDSEPIPTPESIQGGAYVASLGPDEEKIIVIQRGPSGDPSATEPACFPGEKAHEAVEAGWDAVLFVQRHDAAENPPFCGSGAFVDVVVGVCTNHEAFHRLFDSPPFTGPWTYPDGPAIGDVGADVEVGSLFDGWGYVHLFDRETAQDLDTFAIDEAHDPAYAFGFGDLSVHEAATDKTHPRRAYLSYYAGGIRALDIVCSDPNDNTTCELVEVGGYLDEEGNDFWGVETFERDGTTYILGSDRDSGLWVFKRD